MSDRNYGSGSYKGDPSLSYTDNLNRYEDSVRQQQVYTPQNNAFPNQANPNYANSARSYSPSASSGGESGFGQFVMLGILLLVIYAALSWLFNLLSSWRTMSHPYREVSAFYYFTVVVPTRATFNTMTFLSDTGSAFWNYVVVKGLTPYAVINYAVGIGTLGIAVIIGIAIMLILGVLVFSAFYEVYEPQEGEKDTRLNMRVIAGVIIAVCLFFTPALLLLIYSIVLAIVT
jgi:hypothetical protein